VNHKGTHSARLYHRVQDTSLHIIFGIFADVSAYLLKKEVKKKDSKSYLDSKSTLFEIINNFRLHDRVSIVSALIGVKNVRGSIEI